MDNLTIEFDQAMLQRLFRKLGAAASQAVLRPPMVRGLARIQHDLATYPAPAHRRQPPKSDRQRRKVFALIREGKIPYRRTGTLGRRWTTRVGVFAGGGIEGTVGNATAYGPLVESARAQTAYHKGVWPTDESVLLRHRQDILDEFTDAIGSALR